MHIIMYPASQTEVKRKMKKEIIPYIIFFSIVLLFAAAVLLYYFGFRVFYTNPAPGFLELEITKDEWIFYCDLIPVIEDGEQVNEFIDSILPVKKYGFLKRGLSENDPKYAVLNPDGELAGWLYVYEGRNCQYCFFQHSDSRYMRMPDGVNLAWYDLPYVTADGRQYDFYKGSFFTVEREFTTFNMGGYDFELKPWKSYMDGLYALPAA